MSIQEGRMALFLCQPRRGVRKILVTGEALVGDLGDLFPKQNFCFLYNGIVLHNAMKLSSYGICENDKIIAIPETLMNSLESRFTNNRKSTNSQEVARIFLTNNSSITAEIARLKDIKLSKYDFRGISFYKNVLKHIETSDAKLSTQCKTKIPDKFTKKAFPSSEPLPNFWNAKIRAPRQVLPSNIDQEYDVDNSLFVR